jgi:Flp pilus assembly protein TadD
MSIIYGTLERLETDNLTPSYNQENADSSLLAVESRGFLVKTLAAAVMVVLTGTSLMLWRQSVESGGPRDLSTSVDVNESLASGKPHFLLSPASMGEQSTLPLEPTGPDSETPAAQGAVPSVPTLMDAVLAMDKQPIAEKDGPLELDATEEPVFAAAERVDTVSAPVAKAEPVQAVPEENDQTPSREAAQTVEVAEVIDQARIALSRGRYQQALSTLETLGPAPENRADIWLIKGSAQLGIGQLDQAENSFATAQTLAPDNAQIAVQQAILRQERGDHVTALQILKGAAIRHPNVPEIFLNQGYSQQALGAVSDARRSFREYLNMTEGRSMFLQQRSVVKEWLAQVSSFRQ